MSSRQEYQHEYYIRNKEKLKQRSKDWLANNTEQAKTNSQVYYKDNRERLIKKQAEAYAQSPGKRAAHKISARKCHLKKVYGITIERFSELLEGQNKCCAICKTDTPRGNSKAAWMIDHDHACCPGKKSCGKCIRGLLCAKCNWGLGNFNDDPVLFSTASDYVIRHRNITSGGTPNG